MGSLFRYVLANLKLYLEHDSISCTILWCNSNFEYNCDMGSCTMCIFAKDKADIIFIVSQKLCRLILKR